MDECGKRLPQSSGKPCQWDSNSVFQEYAANGVASSADSLSTSVSQSDSILETCWPSVDGTNAYQMLQEVVDLSFSILVWYLLLLLTDNRA